MFLPRPGKVLPSSAPAPTMSATHSTAPTADQVKNRLRSILVTPATTVMKVRTIGTNRPMTSALLPCLSKNLFVLSKYLRLMMRPSRSYNGGPILRPIS